MIRSIQYDLMPRHFYKPKDHFMRLHLAPSEEYQDIPVGSIFYAVERVPDPEGVAFLVIYQDLIGKIYLNYLDFFTEVRDEGEEHVPEQR